MVEQTKDSTFTDYGLACAGSGLSNSDKQLPVSEPAKKSVLQESRNENSMTVSKCIGSPLLVADGGHSGGVIEISETKKPLPERVLSPAKSNTGSGHKVYVRRRPETELAKSHACETQADAIDCPQSKKSTEQGETTQEHAEMNEAVICTSVASPLEGTSSPSFSSRRRSVSPSPGMSGEPGNVNYVHIDSVNPSSSDPAIAKIKLWEERYHCLQSLLRMLDQPDQEDYLKMLRSMSSFELSRHALELEKRSIRLSLEEDSVIVSLCMPLPESRSKPIL
ncbi:hypothetical protein BUALT_Bualt19G0130300 [Buddleja alternifolia]|uniref:Uncharacterized protein n=1 Tax=Buddleja alternifolia TaxID=168488 RepID=A0AAV6W7D0_9LAMI|nr:hypothetical protein BUALT_Bualt19G0130300 [Buddleja alternifolia]